MKVSRRMLLTERWTVQEGENYTPVNEEGPFQFQSEKERAKAKGKVGRYDSWNLLCWKVRWWTPLFRASCSRWYFTGVLPQFGDKRWPSQSRDRDQLETIDTKNSTLSGLSPSPTSFTRKDFTLFWTRPRRSNIRNFVERGGRRKRLVKTRVWSRRHIQKREERKRRGLEKHTMLTMVL